MRIPPASRDNGISRNCRARGLRGRRIACLSLALAVPLLLGSCAFTLQPRYTKEESLVRGTVNTWPWKKIAVLPFTGDPAFRRPAAEWFALQLAELGPFEVIGPARAEIELRRAGIAVGEKEMTNEEAAKAGRMLGADGVIAGFLAGTPLRLTANLLDAASGSMVAASVRSHEQPLWRSTLSFDEHDYAAATAEDAAGDFLPVLYEVAGRHWTPPPKESFYAPTISVPPVQGGGP